jgi:flagella basal body P-ring formation protein FlgA
MSSRAVTAISIICTVALAQFCAASADSQTDESQRDSVLRVYLPREVTVKDSALKLGQIAIVRGDEPLVAKARELSLGRISVPGQEIVVDRAMLLGRLACNGVPASKVTLSGAEKVSVRKQHQIIKGNELVDLARSFLKENPPVASVCQMRPVLVPKDFVMPGPTRDMKLSPRLVRSGAKNQAKVQIVVLADGKELGVREVTFRLQFNSREAVTLVDIPAGAVISRENIKIEKSLSPYPEPANWSPPYGFVARRRLPANTVIRRGMVGPVKPAIVVERNETVVIRIERPGFVITGMGKAMQQARAGDYIKVRNVDSQRIVSCKVNEDGTVEPIL